MDMFEKYGEFDSHEEINKAAAEKLEKGDTEAVIGIAVENGIDKEDAQDYIDGLAPELCTVFMAADGKLRIEEKMMDIAGILKDWTGYIREMCMEDKEAAAAVRKKGKKLEECMAELIKYAFENKVQVSNRIVGITKINHNGKLEQMRGPLYMGVPNRAEAKRIIREYYMGKEEDNAGV